jgi:spore germination protein GerM
MNQTPRRPPSTSAERRRRGRRSGALRWPFWLLLTIVIAAAAWFLWQLGRAQIDQTGDSIGDPRAIADDPPAGDRAVVLVFPEWDVTGYITERRIIPSRGHPEEDLQALFDELCKGPTISGAVSGLPPRTRLLTVFFDRSGRHVVLDFSAELVTEHTGGSASEVATLTSILRTVALNFPELQTCRILVDGSEVETLAGHIGLDAPFDLRRWL